MVNTILENDQAPDGQDYWGPVDASNSFNFVSNTVNSFFPTAQGANGGWTSGPSSGTTGGNVLNNNTSQLGALTTSLGGLIYYPLLANSAAANVGTNSVLATIASAENVSPASQATDEIGACASRPLSPLSISAPWN